MSRIRSFLLGFLLTAVLLSGSNLALAADPTGGQTQTNLSAPPYIEAQAAIVTDQAGHILYNKNEHLRMYPASTTKILTALLAVENCKLEDVVTVGPEITLVPINSGRCGLRQGESITIRELIYGMLLRSGNDAAMTVAVNVARKTGSDIPMNDQAALGEFAWMMNQRAGEIGALDSHFVNPHGLHDPEHYSTAYDLALIARKAMSDPFLSEVVATPAYLPSSKIEKSSGQVTQWVNTNKLLDDKSPFFMPEAVGVKTGHTEEAGYCLVSSASHEQVRIYAVALNSSQNGVWRDSIKLLNYGFTHPPTETKEKKISPPKTRLSSPGLPAWTYCVLIAVGAVLLIFVAIGFSMLASRSKPKN